MDSVTQFALGAGLGVVTMGRKIGPRKAAITGGLMATIPDLDVFWTFDNPVDSFVLHRSVTHSLIIHALAAPIFGWLLTRLFRPLRDQVALCSLFAFILFSTHALLDAVTIYGTQLLWPLSHDAYGLGSLFIIDPLYTLPLAIVTLWAIIWPASKNRMNRMAGLALVVSSGYLVWSGAAQAMMADKFKDYLARRGIEAEARLSIPTPFNTFYWRNLALNQDHVYTVYAPLFSDEDQWHLHRVDRGLALGLCRPGLGKDYQRLARFTDGFYQLSADDGGRIIFSDLRMGLPPGYAFSFALGLRDGLVVIPKYPRRIKNNRGNQDDIEWLLAGLMGTPVARQAEAQNLWPPRTESARQVAIGQSGRAGDTENKNACG